jgi:hypothetical protein
VENSLLPTDDPRNEDEQFRNELPLAVKASAAIVAMMLCSDIDFSACSNKWKNGQTTPVRKQHRQQRNKLLCATPNNIDEMQ